jgi:hypothetical protein
MSTPYDAHLDEILDHAEEVLAQIQADLAAQGDPRAPGDLQARVVPMRAPAQTAESNRLHALQFGMRQIIHAIKTFRGETP